MFDIQKFAEDIARDIMTKAVAQKGTPAENPAPQPESSTETA